MHQTQWSPERPLPPPVSLASQSHHEKPPEVTCTSRGKTGFPASTRERPRETFFNTSRGQSPLPWLGSNDALPSALDPEMVGEVLDLIRELADEGMTMVIVTHEMGFAKEVATKIVFVDEGIIKEENTPKEFFENPQNPRLKEFLSKVL